ncbi:MAG TPA: sterol desaturase family protein [Aggregatilineales bacterium]|nr:sterol desaturase family protein [Aggregatilineales bacterium]
MVTTMIETLKTMPLPLAVLCGVAWNIAMFLGTLIIGHYLVIRFKDCAVTAEPPPISRRELWFVASCVILNSLVTIAGIMLWRADIIHVHFSLDLMVVVDTLVLLFAMDFAMYVLHRVAHYPLIFRIVHETHHRYENPRPLTLFVLNPLETVSFGVLWLVVVTVYTSSVYGIVIYLTLNLAFGLMGHLGVEPFPGIWPRLPLVRLISTSTFHAEHHQDKGHNFGFYTLIWDRLFGTLSPDYLEDFDSATAPSEKLASESP